MSDGTNAATYGYLPQSGLVEQIRFSRSGQNRLTTTRQFDLLNRLTRIASVGGPGSTQASFTYAYNEANQRVRVDLADGSFWIYEYDFLGQVRSGKRYWADGTPVAGQQFEYGFDDIGNRKVARRGGDENGWSLRESLYTPNLLNQYTDRTVPGFADVVGVALATKPVYVNGQMASRKGEYFRRELSVNNAGAPVWLGVTVTSPGEPTVTGNLFVPRTPEVFTHDLDGNLTADGRWTYMWDAENRLIRVQSRSDTPQASWRRIEWQYDALGRRIRQTTWNWLVQSNLWVVTEDLKLVNDPLLFGRHLIELNATNVLVRSYVWGLDLSETLEGAGGVGGLLWVTLHTGSDPAAGTQICVYDGNGNIVALSAASGGSVSARYEYGPFGEPIRVTGPAANQNPFRFSTKRTDPTTDLVLYEYRVYKPSIGRWLSRDPMEEKGAHNLYNCAANDPLDYIDTDGRFTGSKCPVCGQWYQGTHSCKPPSPTPGDKGNNAKRLWPTYVCDGCGSMKDQLSAIPGVSNPPDVPHLSPPMGPAPGTYQIYPFPTTPRSAVGGAGAGPCMILVVKCPDFVAVFHFTAGDSPSGTLRSFSWPSGCSSIICGSNDDPDANCRRKDVKESANAAGLNVVGVSGNSACGVDEDGKWWQWGN